MGKEGMGKERETKECPICGDTMSLSKRYPFSVCSQCKEKTVTINGTPIQFGNIDSGGGFMSVVNGNVGDDHGCYINDIECIADEGRFGGIVVSVVNHSH